MEQCPKKLLDQVRDAIRLKHYSPRTEDSYVAWIRRYTLGKEPRLLPRSRGSLPWRLLVHGIDLMVLGRLAAQRPLHPRGADIGLKPMLKWKPREP